MESKFEVKSETKEENGVKSVELSFTREPNETPDDTVWGVVRQIVRDHNLPNTTELKRDLAFKIKRLVHYEKKDAWSRMNDYCGDSLSEGEKMIVLAKISTHSKLSKGTIDEVVTFDI